MTLEDFYKEYRSGFNPITGEKNLFKDLTDQDIWNKAQEEIRKELTAEIEAHAKTKALCKEFVDIFVYVCEKLRPMMIDNDFYRKAKEYLESIKE